MTRNIQMAMQAFAIAAQVILPAIPGITPEWEQFGHAVIGAAQALGAWLGHDYNPDGTPAVVAYKKGMKIEPPKGE